MFIVAYVREHDYAPTMREIANGLGVSTATVFRHVARLAADGAIRHDAGRSRAIVVLAGVES